MFVRWRLAHNPQTLGFVIIVRRFPRIVVGASIRAALGAFAFFNPYRMFADNLGALCVFILIPVPLFVAGVGLLRFREESDEKV